MEAGKRKRAELEGGKSDEEESMTLWYFRSTPHPVTVTTRIITFLVGNPYKPSFATVTGWGVDPSDTVDGNQKSGKLTSWGW